MQAGASPLKLQELLSHSLDDIVKIQRREKMNKRQEELSGKKGGGQQQASKTQKGGPAQKVTNQAQNQKGRKQGMGQGGGKNKSQQQKQLQQQPNGKVLGNKKWTQRMNSNFNNQNNNNRFGKSTIKTIQKNQKGGNTNVGLKKANGSKAGATIVPKLKQAAATNNDNMRNAGQKVGKKAGLQQGGGGRNMNASVQRQQWQSTNNNRAAQNVLSVQQTARRQLQFLRKGLGKQTNNTSLHRSMGMYRKTVTRGVELARVNQKGAQTVRLGNNGMMNGNNNARNSMYAKGVGGGQLKGRNRFAAFGGGPRNNFNRINPMSFNGANLAMPTPGPSNTFKSRRGNNRMSNEELMSKIKIVASLDDLPPTDHMGHVQQNVSMARGYPMGYAGNFGGGRPSTLNERFGGAMR